MESLAHFPVHCKCLLITSYMYMFIIKEDGGREKGREGKGRKGSNNVGTIA